MTGSTFSRVGRIGLVLFAVAAFGTTLMTWFDGGNGRIIAGVDLYYLREELEAPYPVLIYFLEIAPLSAYIALLLAGTVGVRRRWARIVAVVPVVLAAAVFGLAAAGLLTRIEEYWDAEQVLHYRRYALVTAVLVVPLLAAAGALAAGLRHVYHGFVVVLLLGFAAFQFACTALISVQGVGSTMTVVPWLGAVAYLLAAGCALLVATTSPAPDSPSPDALPSDAVRSGSAAVPG